MSEPAKITDPAQLKLAQGLAIVAAEAGIDAPADLTRMVPTIDLTKNIRAIAHELGGVLSKQNIFFQSGDVVTVDHATGDIEIMDSKDFPSWAEEFCAFTAHGSRRIRSSMNVDESAQILKTKVFKQRLRPLTAVHKMRLPVLREDGTPSFLEPGYDEASGILTLDLLPYNMEWPLEEAVKWLMDIHADFPWNKRDDEDLRSGLKANRSFSVHMLAMVGNYCRGFFPPSTLKPIIAYFANKPGSGKTRLVEMDLSPVYGYVAATGTPKDQEKLDVKLETVAQSMQPYLVLDDIGGLLRSNSLNRWTSESWHAGRKFHSNKEFFMVPNVTQVYVTANDLKTSEDLARRALIAELFLEEEVKGRKYPFVITNKWLGLPETRAKFLAACCALVKEWIARGMERHWAPLETYEEWTGIVGMILIECGFWDPLQAPENVVGGASDEDEIKRLLIVVASAQEEDCTVSRTELVRFARENGLLEDLVGNEGDEPIDATTSKRLGKRLMRFRSERLKDDKGRMFQFSHKRKNTGAVYPIAFVKPKGAAALAAEPVPDIAEDPIIGKALESLNGRVVEPGEEGDE